MVRDLFVPGKKATSQKPIPFRFVLEALSSLDPLVRPMFGCHAVYDGEKILLILREKPAIPEDNGVWIATTEEHHASLKKEFPSLRGISVFEGKGAWRMLPVDSADFEESVNQVCDLILRRDHRIGKVPGSRAKTSKKKATSRKKK